jgi:hypothetical protein
MIDRTRPSPRLRNPADISATMIHIAMIDNLSRRLTDETTPTWRDT